MENSNLLAEKIIAEFPELKDSIKVQRARRIWVKVPYPALRKVLEKTAGFGVNIFCMLTGLDDKENYSFIYHMADEAGVMLNIETSIPKTGPLSVATITDMYPAADLQEREVFDLLGIKFEGLGPGKRYPLPDNWPDGEFPLRKDWKVEERLDPKEPFKKKE